MVDKLKEKHITNAPTQTETEINNLISEVICSELEKGHFSPEQIISLNKFAMSLLIEFVNWMKGSDSWIVEKEINHE